jgi:hypothetical protein
MLRNLVVPERESGCGGVVVELQAWNHSALVVGRVWNLFTSKRQDYLADNSPLQHQKHQYCSPMSLWH